MAVPFGPPAYALLRNRRKTRTAERLRQCTALGGSGRGKLLFDPLEPRLLMSGDILSINLAQGALAHQDHSLVVQMVTQTEQVNQTSQNVQRVEVVDQAQNNAVLAFGDLSVITQVNIVGNAQSTNTDTITIDANSFGAVTLPAVHSPAAAAPTRSPSRARTARKTGSSPGLAPARRPGPPT